MHQWRGFYGKQVDYKHYYHAWIFGRRTLTEISYNLDVSVPTLRSKFDSIDVEEGLVHYPDNSNPSINLQIDATYFGNEYGYICFHDGKRVVYFHEIKAETSYDIILGLRTLKQAGYRFRSVTIDGRKGFEGAIRKELGGVPIQLCLFHARAIVRRYLGPNPTTEVAQDLAELMSRVRYICPQEFIDQFHNLELKHRVHLIPPTVVKNRRRQRIRLAYRFVHNNMHRIFTFRDLPNLNIPPTTNHLEGMFSHIKERLKIHRGLQQNNKKKAIKFLLINF